MALSSQKYSSNELDSDRPLRLEHRFLVLRKLGQGTYGKVQLALNKETNEEVAVKTIKKAKIENEEDMLRIRREIHIMTALRHPNIIHIHEVFETRQKIVIVMQYASGGELYDYLGCHQTLPEDESRRIFRQIASAIYYCHKNKICHRDLKLENILLDDEGNAQIADFGLSNMFDDKRRMNTFCGSPLYASPEIVKGTPYKGPEVDCWSLGVLLYTLVYGTMPFDGRSFKELVSQISEGRYEEPVHKSNASSLIRWLLTPDISRRATITDVCKDSWVNDGYDTSLLEVAENMALAAGLHREQIRATKLSLETNNKYGCEKSIFKKAATQIEEKAGKFTSIFTKNLENTQTNDTIQHTRKNSFYDQITNYDVRFVINKLIAAVEASLIAEKYSQKFSNSKHNIVNTQNVKKKEEASTEKIDSAYIIPIFEVTSVIPNERVEIQNAVKKAENENATPKMSLKSVISKLEKDCDRTAEKKDINVDDANGGRKNVSEIDKKTSKISRDGHKIVAAGTPQQSQTFLTDSQKQFRSFSVPGQTELLKADGQSRKMHPYHPSQKNKLNDSVPFNQKQPGPFMRTKHHVLSLARILSLNYERIMRNSFRMPTCKKKPPGKITIPPTFDPNNPLPAVAKKQQDEKKELLIFPTVSVSENKEKIQKKIEKIKKAALDKNFIIRSDSKTRVRIENYIRSQVKKIQDLVREEQRSLQASLEHLDEQSLRDMSEMYYCAFGSENTDSGIANAEDEEYFCFLCSKPTTENGTPGIVDSFILESMKKGFLYTSNHLHVPRGKEQNKWGYTSNNNNMEFGSLSRCKSEIKLASDYLNYISPNKKSDLSKRTQAKQQIQARNIGNIKCFFTVPSSTKSEDSNFRILRSASDSAGLNLSKNTYDVVKLHNESHDAAYQNFKLLPHFLEHVTSNRCNYSQTTEYETQSCATDATFMNTSQMLEKDDGIGDSNDSFQSYMETLDNNDESDSAIVRSMSSHSYMNFKKDALNNQRLPATLLAKSHLKQKYESENDRKPTDLETNIADSILFDSLDSISLMTALEKENEYLHETQKSKGLRRRNTMSCLPQDSKAEEKFTNNQCSTEFENYLWNAYKEHLLENTENDSECSSFPNLNYYSLDRKSTFKSRDSKSMDYINGDNNTDFLLKQFSNFAPPDHDSNEDSPSIRKSTLKHYNASKTLPGRSGSRLSRTKSVCTDEDRDDIIRKLREDRKLSVGSSPFDANSSSRSPFLLNHINDLESKDQRRKADRDSNRRRYSKTNLPLSKRTKSEYKKSFLQLLALKRIQEAEKELNKNPRNELPNVEEENSGSLLEALKTHGYKNVISQRFQDTDDDDFLDPFSIKYLKSPRYLRAELARLNYMYYESLPRYNLDPYEENDYSYDDLDYTRNFLNGLAIPSLYDTPTDFRPQAKRTVHDWLDNTQFNTLRSDSFYIPEEEASTSERRKCCTQWGSGENCRSFDDESTSESQDTIEETSSNNTFKSYSKSRDPSISHEPNFGITERSQTSAINTDDESQESVHDRIWRKSFYPRFNNRALSRKERLSFIEPHLSESRLGQLNNLYSNPLKTGHEKSELSQWDGSNKSFHMKRSKKLSSSYDKFNSRTSLKNKLAKSLKDKEITLNDEESSSSKKLTEACITNENEEPEH